MPADYLTMPGDRLDRICRVTYGSERNGAVEAVLVANRGLASRGVVLPGGLLLTMPDIAVKSKIHNVIQLWN